MKWMILRIENLALKEKYAELAKAIRKKNQFVKKLTCSLRPDGDRPGPE